MKACHNCQHRHNRDTATRCRLCGARFAGRHQPFPELGTDGRHFSSSPPPRPVAPVTPAPTTDDPTAKAKADAAAVAAKALAQRRQGAAANILTYRGPGVGAPRGVSLLGGGER